VTSDSGKSQLDAFIHIDALDPQYVYNWRLEQEAGLRAMKGSGMTDEQVKKFVDGCKLEPLIEMNPTDDSEQIIHRMSCLPTLFVPAYLEVKRVGS
jgi:pantothenate kinase-related protein Tda10